MTHIWVNKLPIIGSDNGLLPGQRQAIMWTNAWILLIWPLRTNFSEILIVILTFPFNKMHLKRSSAKCLGFNVLTHRDLVKHIYASLFVLLLPQPMLTFCFNFSEILIKIQLSSPFLAINHHLHKKEACADMVGHGHHPNVTILLQLVWINHWNKRKYSTINSQ